MTLRTYTLSFSVLFSLGLRAQYLGGSGDGGAEELFQGTLNGAQIATQLAFTSVPTSVLSNESFSVLIEIRDAAGNLATFSSLANGSVALAIDNNPASGTLSGTTPVSAVDAVATFSGMSINNAGIGYTLEATVSTLSATSAGFDVICLYCGGSGDGGVLGTNPTSTLNGQSVVIWRGGNPGNETDWATAANWVDGAVAGSGDNVYIEPNGNGHQPVLAANTSIAYLNFNAAQKLVELDNFDLTITGNIDQATPSEYVQTNDTGALIKQDILQGESFEFPVGNSGYNPLTITNNTNADEWFSVRVLDSVYLSGYSGPTQNVPHVQRTWDIGKETPSGYSGTVDFDFRWNTGEEFGSIANYVLFHYEGPGQGWFEALTGNGVYTPNRLVYTGYYADFSPFAIGDQTQPLPVELLFFKAMCAGKAIEFNWATASETNNRAFLLESSANAKHWQPFAEIPGAGFTAQQQNYSIQADVTEAPGPYYRLYQEDYDGQRSYFQPLYRTCQEQEGLDWRIAPNPANHETYVLGLDPRVPYQILDMSGRQLFSGQSEQEDILRVDLSSLSPGIYLLSTAFGQKPLLVVRP